MGLIPQTPEEREKLRRECTDYRCRYCGHVAKSLDWKSVDLCVNWTTKHRTHAFWVCPKCNVIDSVERKRWDEDDSKYRRMKYPSYKIVKNDDPNEPKIYDFAPSEEVARQWHEVHLEVFRKRKHPDDLFPWDGKFSYNPERRKNDEDGI
jgi:hypothetical protein